MFKVKKGNRVLTVNETEKAFYLSEGYDVVEFSKEVNDYVVTERATGGRTYTVAEYNKVLEENQKLIIVANQIKTGVGSVSEDKYNQVVAENEELKAELAELKKVSDDKVEPDREEIKAKLVEKGIDFNDNSKTSTLVKLLEGSGE